MAKVKRAFIISRLIKLNWVRNCRHCRKKRQVRYDLMIKEIAWSRVIFTFSDYYCTYCAQKLLTDKSPYIINVKTSLLDNLLRGKL